MVRKSAAVEMPEARTTAQDLATYEVELRTLKANKKNTTSVINDRIKIVEGLIATLSDEILGTHGSQARLFEHGDDDED
jgi:hypothetical protein